MNSIVIGVNAECSHDNCVIIGNNLKSDHHNQIKIGNLEIVASGEITNTQVEQIHEAFLGLLNAHFINNEDKPGSVADWIDNIWPDLKSDEMWEIVDCLTNVAEGMRNSE